jgi:CheY-like chemotaxis protein
MAVVLVVEDEVFIREIAEMTLEDLGHDIISATDVREALILLRSSQPVDALFTDIRLKDEPLGGYELARQAVSLRPGLRVLYTSGNVASTDDIGAMIVAHGRFLEKPYAPNQLQSSMEELLAAAF